MAEPVSTSRWAFVLATVLALVLLAAACGNSSAADTDGGSEPVAEAAAEEAVTLRLGYFPNVTHAPAVAGLEEGIFAEALGDGVTLETVTFNSGTEAIEALFSDAIDASFIGPNPAINGFAQSQGEALRIIAGSTSGGAALVVREGIENPEDLAGTTLATPSLGNTQDVALRAWLAEQGYETDAEGGGDVSIVPQENAQTLEAFQTGDIDGAWLPEPWASRLILEADAQALLDEAELWPEGQFVTTHLIVGTSFLEEHRDVVSGLLQGQIAAVDFVNEEPDAAKAATNAGIEAVTDAALPEELIDAAWENLEFTVDPIASSLAESATDAEAVGLLEPVDLAGIYDLEPLNTLLESDGRSTVEGLR